MIADFHVHTPYCGHAQGKIINYVETAIANGIQEIGFADHFGRYYLSKSQRRRYWDWGMNERDLARYYAELLDLKEVFKGDIEIRIGLEIDYVEGAEELIAPIMSIYPFDFFLCSVHCLPRFGWRHLANYPKGDSAPVYREYFSVIRSALKSTLFQSLAHIDFIWRYVPWPSSENGKVLEDLDNTIKAAADAGSIVEVNANGYVWSQNNAVDLSMDPFETLLNCIHRYHVPISIGSDAHDPKMVGKAFPELLNLLRQKGITTMMRFSEGKAIAETIG
jgi:histidinol-phosphatase (PHP family)